MEFTSITSLLMDDNLGAQWALNICAMNECMALCNHVSFLACYKAVIAFSEPVHSFVESGGTYCTVYLYFSTLA